MRALQRPSGHVTGAPLITSCHIDENSVKETLIDVCYVSVCFELPCLLPAFLQLPQYAIKQLKFRGFVNLISKILEI